MYFFLVSPAFCGPSMPLMTHQKFHSSISFLSIGPRPLILRVRSYPCFWKNCLFKVKKWYLAQNKKLFKIPLAIVKQIKKLFKNKKIFLGEFRGTKNSKKRQKHHIWGPLTPPKNIFFICFTIARGIWNNFCFGLNIIFWP